LSHEAVRLREAATAFGDHVRSPAIGTFDKAGQKLNRELLAAAIAYARVGDKLYREAAEILGDIDDGLIDGSIEASGTIEYLCDWVRPLVCRLLGHKPACGNTPQCRERGKMKHDADVFVRTP